jgi:hypothetical protein
MNRRRPRDLGDVVLLAHLHDAFAAIDLPRYAELLFDRASFAFHDLCSF